MKSQNIGTLKRPNFIYQLQRNAKTQLIAYSGTEAGTLERDSLMVGHCCKFQQSVPIRDICTQHVLITILNCLIFFFRMCFCSVTAKIPLLLLIFISSLIESVCTSLQQIYCILFIYIF